MAGEVDAAAAVPLAAMPAATGADDSVKAGVLAEAGTTGADAEGVPSTAVRSKEWHPSETALQVQQLGTKLQEGKPVAEMRQCNQRVTLNHDAHGGHREGVTLTWQGC